MKFVILNVLVIKSSGTWSGEYTKIGINPTEILNVEKATIRGYDKPCSIITFKRIPYGQISGNSYYCVGNVYSIITRINETLHA